MRHLRFATGIGFAYWALHAGEVAFLVIAVWNFHIASEIAKTDAP